MNNFVPLHIVSCYSFLQSGLTMEKIQDSVIKNDYFGMGLCDKGVMFGVPSFVKASEQAKRPYIIGLETKTDDDFICLYAINEEGYHHLMEISTAIQKEEMSFDLLKQKSSGLVAIIETNKGKFYELFTAQDTTFNRYLMNLSETFKDGFYLGIEVIKKEDVSFANSVRRFANEYTYNCIAFPTILYQKKDDAIVLKIVEAIANEETLSEKKMDGQQYFMPISSYEKIYTKAEINNTRKLLESSTFDFHNKRGEILHYPVINSEETLKDNCLKSLKSLGLDTNQVYIERLNKELETIISLGYADYFLIVQDYVSFAKSNGIIVGCGRGSAAGCLVSYLLDITQIDPIENDLQFERFLNPYRKTMPDIDVDFMDVRRDEVVQYMRDKYGNDRVANIVTFQTIQAKQSLRDIGRVYGFPNNHIDLLSKRITKHDVSLREAYKTLPEFKNLVDSDSYFLQIVSLASKIEGLIRQSGLHAAGIILNNSPLENALPVLTDFSDHYISQYEMGCLEEQGFLKMDFLGLRNLTTIARAVDLINERYPNSKLDAQHLPYDDPKVYELICSGQTMGLFQIETMAMKRAIKIIKPNCFNDVVALLALNRPGPMAFIPNYAKRKEGKEQITYIDSSLEPFLKSTYGILTYQEQINQIATTFAGYTMGEADMFRRVVSKKKKEEMANSRVDFIKRSVSNGHDEKTASKVFDLIERFANYGFNKSHSVAYSIIACSMAYLKAYYPLEFYSAILETSSSTNDTKFNEYVSEMRKRNIKIVSPQINLSGKEFIVKDDTLLYPLSAIHGINELLVNNILIERNNGEFKDFFDFVSRMFKYKISETQITRLIDAGCFDTFDPSRASFRVSIKSALQYAELSYREDGQLDLGVSALITPYLVRDHDDPIENLDKEYEALGIMLSSNPLRYKADILRAKKIDAIVDAKEAKSAKVAGLVRSVKTISTKKGSTMAFVKLADETDEIEITIFSDEYVKNVALLEKNKLIIASIKAEKRNDSIDYICNQIEPLEEE
ncbi:MAG: DNA polymerase III subunit alpha [Bacilli bacterium]|nr:DNA polymerase III subunit alpha [Bacilli bacterium]